MRWQLSDRFDPIALPIADRHYNRQKIGSSQFVAPGSCVVLRTPDADALWVTLYQRPEYTDHAWPGLWVNSIFRNESQHLSSELIREAIAATRAIWDAPDEGCITFIDTKKVRHKRDPGRCYLKAGFRHVGWTKGGLRVLGMTSDVMPPAHPAMGTQGAIAI